MSTWSEKNTLKEAINYKKLFRDMMKDNPDKLSAAVECFNFVADRRYFEHMKIAEIDGKLLMGEREEVVTSPVQIIRELLYWLSCYYESGNIRHDEEFSDRKLLIRCAEVFKENFPEEFRVAMKEWYIPNKNETQSLFA